MPCFHPLAAWYGPSGKVCFKWEKGLGKPLSLPCGQCFGCRLERSRQWAMRCMHEAQMHMHNQFVTLTYNNESVPQFGSLHYPHFQQFCRALRYRQGSFRFYMCGEYGEQYGRPHFHACLFGVDFPDRELHSRLDSGSTLFTSKALEACWPHGFASTADVTFESAAYVARYCMKKVTGAAAEEHYTRVLADGSMVKIEPEFSRMSRGGRKGRGIGHAWYDKYKNDVYPHDYVIVNGMPVKPPKAYDRYLKDSDAEAFDIVRASREVKALASMPDNTYDRLRARESVSRARMSFKIRSLA